MKPEKKSKSDPAQGMRDAMKKAGPVYATPKAYVHLPNGSRGGSPNPGGTNL